MTDIFSINNTLYSYTQPAIFIWREFSQVSLTSLYFHSIPTTHYNYFSTSFFRSLYTQNSSPSFKKIFNSSPGIFYTSHMPKTALPHLKAITNPPTQKESRESFGMLPPKQTSFYYFSCLPRRSTPIPRDSFSFKRNSILFYKQ